MSHNKAVFATPPWRDGSSALHRAPPALSQRASGPSALNMGMWRGPSARTLNLCPSTGITFMVGLLAQGCGKDTAVPHHGQLFLPLCTRLLRGQYFLVRNFSPLKSRRLFLFHQWKLIPSSSVLQSLEWASGCDSGPCTSCSSGAGSGARCRAGSRAWCWAGSRAWCWAGSRAWCWAGSRAWCWAALCISWGSTAFPRAVRERATSALPFSGRCNADNRFAAGGAAWRCLRAGCCGFLFLIKAPKWRTQVIRLSGLQRGAESQNQNPRMVRLGRALTAHLLPCRGLAPCRSLPV